MRPIGHRIGWLFELQFEAKPFSLSMYMIRVVKLNGRRCSICFSINCWNTMDPCSWAWISIARWCLDLTNLLSHRPVDMIRWRSDDFYIRQNFTMFLKMT